MICPACCSLILPTTTPVTMDGRSVLPRSELRLLDFGPRHPLGGATSWGPLLLRRYKKNGEQLRAGAFDSLENRADRGNACRTCLRLLFLFHLVLIGCRRVTIKMKSRA
jgi:hypothetical protein